jgi:hypothetical protein
LRAKARNWYVRLADRPAAFWISRRSVKSGWDRRVTDQLIAAESGCTNPLIIHIEVNAAIDIGKTHHCRLYVKLRTFFKKEGSFDA